ncbi:hypothetical protein KY290_008563 [Solanum tuberosum]|uniref:Uncharacterized protein n=1 Tax=Solanum tuberosum TaxID=4113 RepID=A0ABQ7WBF5_SOLTU|nr:hypothetical protein KY290_008563 [Solanum tuberosum]
MALQQIDKGSKKCNLDHFLNQRTLEIMRFPSFSVHYSTSSDTSELAETQGICTLINQQNRFPSLALSSVSETEKLTVSKFSGTHFYLHAFNSDDTQDTKDINRVEEFIPTPIATQISFKAYGNLARQDQFDIPDSIFN